MHFFVTIFCHHMQSQNYHGRKFSDFLPDFQPPIMHFFVTIFCHHMQSQNYHGRKISDFLPDFQPPIMHFFVTIFCHHMHSQNYKLTPAPLKIASQFSFHGNRLPRLHAPVPESKSESSSGYYATPRYLWTTFHTESMDHIHTQLLCQTNSLGSLFS
jgi:hypothetical protein